ncbi:glycosyltransferase family 4 protein [Halobacteriovorax sp. HLS]|uniref:glycosyltransferase family 4 protein n=1 Tax=Halobacteriovorax sp. HLS TaxID=2234000 RepID=UPI000FD8A354|nr:glycosyltransferase family 4 protein [Halobacteriovorax sp. HLS]
MKDKKLKILFVSPDGYYPENLNGVNKINFNLVKENNLYTIDFLSRFFDSKPPSFTCIENHYSTKKRVKQRSKLRSLLSLTPYNISPISEINDLIEFINKNSKKYDIIHLSSVALINAIHQINESEKVFFSSIDSLSLIMLRKYKAQKSLLKKLLYYYEYIKCTVVEKNAYKKIKKCHFVSDIDALFAKDKLGLKSPVFIPNGIDTKQFYDSKQSRDNKKLLFVGNYNYAPNQEAVDFIINDLGPKLFEKDKEIRIFLVGANPTQKMLNLEGHPNIIVTGKVENLDKYLQSARFFISPIFSGAGIKNKVLEAMASGLITVSSKLSLDGINHPINYVTIDNEKSTTAWIDAICNSTIYDDSEMEKNISLFHKEYSWDNIRERYYKEYIKQRDL